MPQTFYEYQFGSCDYDGCGKPATHEIRGSNGASRYRNSCARHVKAQINRLTKAHAR